MWSGAAHTWDNVSTIVTDILKRLKYEGSSVETEILLMHIFKCVQNEIICI